MKHLTVHILLVLDMYGTFLKLVCGKYAVKRILSLKFNSFILLFPIQCFEFILEKRNPK